MAEKYVFTKFLVKNPDQSRARWVNDPNLGEIVAKGLFVNEMLVQVMLNPNLTAAYQSEKRRYYEGEHVRVVDNTRFELDAFPDSELRYTLPGRENT